MEGQSGDQREGILLVPPVRMGLQANNDSDESKGFIVIAGAS